MSSEGLGVHLDCIFEGLESDVARYELFEGEFIACASLSVLAVIFVSYEGVSLVDNIQQGGKTVLAFISAE